MSRSTGIEAGLQRIWSGEARGIGTELVRLALLPPALLYGGVVRLRNLAYDVGISRSHAATPRIVTIGNLTAGGTGKTPMVEWVVRKLLDDAHPVAILSRGYGLDQDGLNDEARVLRATLPDVPHLLGSDRVANAERAAQEGARVVVLDDGFQHRRLRRDLDIVLLDASAHRRAYHGLPLGTMRESFRGLGRAGFVVFTRVDHADPENLDWLRARVERASPGIPTADAVHGVSGLVDLATGEAIDADDRCVYAFCALGNPGAFERTVRSLGVRCLGASRFGDHHHYTQGDVEAIEREAAAAGATALVTTRKDAVKIDPAWCGLPILVLEIAMQIRRGEAELLDAVRSAVGPA